MSEVNDMIAERKQRREEKYIRNRVIEECALVADDYADKVFDDPVSRTIAAAIRALKDKL